MHILLLLIHAHWSPVTGTYTFTSLTHPHTHGPLSRVRACVYKVSMATVTRVIYNSTWSLSGWYARHNHSPATSDLIPLLRSHSLPLACRHELDLLLSSVPFAKRKATLKNSL